MICCIFKFCHWHLLVASAERRGDRPMSSSLLLLYFPVNKYLDIKNEHRLRRPTGEFTKNILFIRLTDIGLYLILSSIGKIPSSGGSKGRGGVWEVYPPPPQKKIITSFLRVSLWFGDILSEKQCPICLRLHEKTFKITSAIINQTSPNLHGSCRNTSRWCLQNYIENGLELTSELTSKWITFNNTQSNFTPISLITFAVINQTSPNLQDSCHNASRWCLQNYMENGWELTSELTSKWITFSNSQSNFTPSSLITSAIINQTSPNLHGSCRNTSRCCLQNYMGNG